MERFGDDLNGNLQETDQSTGIKLAEEGISDDDLYDEGVELFGEGEYEKAFNIFFPLAEKGHDMAQWALAEMYADGLYVEQNIQEAIEWYTKSVQQGNPYAKNNLAHFYYNGIFVDADYNKAVALYKEAAEQGVADAQRTLGYFYSDGEKIQPDYAEAIKWFEMAAAQGDGAAWGQLGSIYCGCKTVRTNEARANFCYEKGVELGDMFSIIQMGFRLVRRIYDKGGVERGIQLCHYAADNGVPDGHMILGELYADEKGGYYDLAKALHFFTLAYEAGDERAYPRMNQVHYQLTGTIKN